MAYPQGAHQLPPQNPPMGPPPSYYDLPPPYSQPVLGQIPPQQMVQGVQGVPGPNPQTVPCQELSAAEREEAERRAKRARRGMSLGMHVAGVPHAFLISRLVGRAMSPGSEHGEPSKRDIRREERRERRECRREEREMRRQSRHSQ